MRAFKFLQEHFSHLALAKKFLVIFLVLVLLGVSVWAGFQFGYKKQKTIGKAVSPQGTIISGTPEEAIDFANPINGLLFKKSEAQAWVNQLPLAVIIENSTDARPQTGLSNADVVYEALAEGGITRFLAVFLQNDSELGPVRSNRPYFIDWLSEYDAAYAHVGGSPEGQFRVKSYGIKDLDQFFVGAPTYERISSRAAPHNVYTTTQKLRAAAAARGYTKGADITSWAFTDSEPTLAQRPAAFALSVGFLGISGYKVRWVYNPATNTYLRENGGVAHIDALTNKQLEFKTIVLQTVSYSYDPSGHGRLFMVDTGSGSAQVFLNGTVVTGTWKKDARTSRTVFLDASGKPIKFNRGKVWIEIVPPESVNSY